MKSNNVSIPIEIESNLLILAAKKTDVWKMKKPIKEITTIFLIFLFSIFDPIKYARKQYSRNVYETKKSFLYS